MKRFLGIFLSLVIVFGTFSVLPVTVSAEGTGGLIFELNDDGASYSVTAYSGDYTDELSIPSKYNDLPVTKIARYAFEYNNNIGSVFIPDSIEEIDEMAFYGCDYLESFSVSSDNRYFSTVDGVLFNKEKTQLVRYPDNKYSTSYTIPDGTKYIGSYAFARCAPRKVILSDGVLSLGEKSFAHSDIKEIIFSDTVTEIEKEAFYGCDQLTSVSLTASIEEIDATAFNDCDNITLFSVASGSEFFSTIDGVLFNKTKTELVKYPCGLEDISYTIPDGVKYIGAYAFSGAFELTKVVPSDDLISIGEYAFAYCGNFEKITLPDTVTEIGQYAFYDCYISKMIIPDGVTELADGVFAWCNLLSSVTLPEGLESIGDGAFNGCSKLTKLTIPSTVTYIGDEAFRGCVLTSVIIPEKVTDIGKYVFFGCELSSIVFPDSVKNIGKGALFDCPNLKTVTIGKGLENLDIDVFAHCVNLESINVDEDNENFVSVGGVLFNKSKTELIQYPMAKSGTSYTIPDGVEKIWIIGFNNCDNLTSVVMPDSVSYIGDSVFSGCDNLSSVTLGNGLKTISNSAFENCKKLTSIEIPESVTHINERAFSGCENLSTVTIKGENISHIGIWAFSNTAFFNDSNNWENGSLYLKNCLLSVDSKVEGIYRIKDNTKVIAEQAAYNCDGITALSFPDTVTDIGRNAFRFGGNIKSVFIPESVSYIGMEAFWGCDAIENIYYTGSEKQWNAIEIGDYNPILADAKIHYSYICEHTEYEWITDADATVYKAGSKHKECTQCGEILETAEIHQLKAGKPKLKSIENTEYGVLTKWSKVSGADKYRVYRKTSKSDWVCIATTSNTYYTDKTAKSGTKYYYAVKSRNEAGNSSLSSSLSRYYLADPTLKTISTTEKGVGLKWTKVTGAQGYIVYRKNSSGSYTKLKTEKGVSNISFRDTSAKKGKKYTYKVKAYYSKTYSAYSNTKTITDKY